MIICELRLKNIRSYSTDTSGNGVTIKFHPGVNRISGRNGYGKSTIIEAIGYALFEAKPKCIESFDATTYFVRTGCSSAEIDVTFSCGNETYRVERGLGFANKRRAKVVHVDDNSICAENEQEVSSFLCRLLGFVDSAHLSEIFIKLIGIKQGHLTRPFDSKPSHAKDFFEPLLQVEIFRQCYDQIKPAIDKFDIQINNHRCLLATEEERIRERQDSPAALITKRETLLKLEQQVRTTTKTLDSLRIEKEKLETDYAAIINITHRRSETQLAHSIQEQKRIHAQAQANLSRQAVVAVKDLLPSYRLFVEAESNIKKLRDYQDKQRNLSDTKNNSENQKLILTSKLQAATDRINLLTTQIETKNYELTQLKQDCFINSQKTEQNKKSFQNRVTKIQQAERYLALIRNFVANLTDKIKYQQQLLAQIGELDKKRAAFDHSQLERTHNLITKAKQQLQGLVNELAVLQERRQNLELQQKIIDSGHCPLSFGECHSHSGINISDNIDQLSIKINRYLTLIESKQKKVDTLKKHRDKLTHDAIYISNQHEWAKKLTTELQKSIKSLTSDNILQYITALRDCVSIIPNLPLDFIRYLKDPNNSCQTASDFQQFFEDWWGAVEISVTQTLHKEIEELNLKTQNQYHVNYQNDLLIRFADEISMLTKAKQAEHTKYHELKTQAADVDTTIIECATKLAEFEYIDDELTKQTNVLDANRANYLAYLSVYPIAEQAQSREAELQSCLAAEKSTANTLAILDHAIRTIQIEFDHQKLHETTAMYLEKSNEVAVYLANCNYAKESLNQEELRYKEWDKACTAKNHILKQINRLTAAQKLGEFARNILKQAAPVVAQYLCNTIATRAQKIFNTINGEPVELRWCANRYSLRVVPGERRFAMLSGGEQNKLALSMVLAMVEEFSKLKFCIFDEPTYGTDIYSREKLAKAILATKDVADIEQLIIVSHDDVFESQAEHRILLTKTSTYGTEVKYCN